MTEPILLRLSVHLSKNGFVRHKKLFVGEKKEKIYVVYEVDSDGQIARSPNHVRKLLKPDSIWLDSHYVVRRSCYCLPEQESEAYELLTEKVTEVAMKIRGEAMPMFNHLPPLE